MSLGTILVSLAVVLGVGAYVAWPFRRAVGAMAPDGDVDRLVEAWVRRAQTAQAAVAERAAGEVEPPRETVQTASPVPAKASTPVVAATISGDDVAVNFCPYCGRRVEHDHVFCPKCGKQLVKGEAR